MRLDNLTHAIRKTICVVKNKTLKHLERSIKLTRLVTERVPYLLYAQDTEW